MPRQRPIHPAEPLCGSRYRRLLAVPQSSQRRRAGRRSESDVKTLTSQPGNKRHRAPRKGRTFPRSRWRLGPFGSGHWKTAAVVCRRALGARGPGLRGADTAGWLEATARIPPQLRAASQVHNRHGLMELRKDRVGENSCELARRGDFRLRVPDAGSDQPQNSAVSIRDDLTLSRAKLRQIAPTGAKTGVLADCPYVGSQTEVHDSGFVCGTRTCRRTNRFGAGRAWSEGNRQARASVSRAQRVAVDPARLAPARCTRPETDAPRGGFPACGGDSAADGSTRRGLTQNRGLRGLRLSTGSPPAPPSR